MRFWGMFRFTLGEALRRGTLIFYFAVGTIILLFFALGVGHLPDDPNMITFFGSPIAQKANASFNMVEMILLQLHSASVFWIILLGVFGTSGMIPRMLDKGTIDLFLSKPLSRGELFMARSAGAVSGVGANLIYFFVGIWCIFGLKLGVWHWGFLASLLLVIFAFFCFYSIVALIGLVTRSSAISIMLSFIFALFSGALGSRETGLLYMIWDNVVYRRVLDAIYYLTPQLSGMLDNSSRLIAKNPFILNSPDFTYWPYVYSSLSASLIYLLAIWYFSRRDY